MLPTSLISSIAHHCCNYFTIYKMHTYFQRWFNQYRFRCRVRRDTKGFKMRNFLRASAANPIVRVAVVILIAWISLAMFLITLNFILHSKSPEKELKRHTGEDILQVVHLDLKGSPPTLEYLTRVMFKLARIGVRAVMIEYDDMFPYQDSLVDLSARSAFTTEEISDLVTVCHFFNIEIIPMIQTFGRLEHVLKLGNYSHFREVNDDTRDACPTQQDLLPLLKEMIVQILEHHPYAKRIHIGSDKIENIKKCHDCLERAASEQEIFIEHIKSVAGFIRKRYRGRITTLMWDDMLRPISIDLLKRSKLRNMVEIVIQDDNKSKGLIPRLLRETLWEKYVKVFNRIWLSGAFRGADDTFSLLPALKARRENQEIWLEFIKDKISWPGVTIVGYILAGSSKADHFAASVDLLPLTEPSFLFNALKMSAELKTKPDKHAYLEKFSEIFGCEPALTSPDTLDYEFLVENCTFETKQLIKYTLEFLEALPQVNELYANFYENNPYITHYHFEHKFINPIVLEELYSEHHLLDICIGFNRVFDKLMEEMLKFFKVRITRDWFEMCVETFEVKVRTLISEVNTYHKFRTFPRRG